MKHSQEKNYKKYFKIIHKCLTINGIINRYILYMKRI